MSEYKFYQRKTSDGIDKRSWVPGTPAKLFPVRRPLEINPVCDFRVVDNKACNEAPERQSGGAGSAGLPLYSAGLMMDLNKSCDEWQDFDGRFKAASSAQKRVVDYPGMEPTSFGFNDCIVEVDAVPRDSNFLSPEGSNECFDDMEWRRLADIPFTELLTSCTLASQESVISTTQDVAVDRTTVDTQIDKSTKESDLLVKDADISVPGTFTEVLSSTTVDVSVSQDSANSTTHDGVAGTCSPVMIIQGAERSTNEPDRSDLLLGHSQHMTENMQKDTRNAGNVQAHNNTTTESSDSQYGQQKAQEDVDYEMGAENVIRKAEKKRKMKLKPKRKKHRPRVVDENKKPKKVAQPKTPKAVTPKRPSSKENLASKKRKYVSKSGRGVSISDEPFPKRRQAAKETSKKNEKSCKRALDFDMNNPPTCAHQLEIQKVDECVNSGEQCEEFFPRKWKKIRSKRRRRLNILFMPKLILGCAGIQRKRKRSRRRMICRSNLALLLALPVCDQLPRLSFDKAKTGGKEATEAICRPEAMKKIMLINYYHERKVMESWRKKMEMRSVDLELDNNKPEGTQLENENCLFTAKHRGSQRVTQEDRIDSAVQAYLQESANFGLTVTSTSSQEALQEQRIDSLNQKVPAEPNYMSFVFRTTGSQEISEKKGNGCVTEGAESKEIILLTKKFNLLKIKGRGGQHKKQGRRQGLNSDNGTLVPYQEQPGRNRKRITAKVDLDPDTMRVWNRLMNIEDANEEKIDPDKEEWWRRERDVFQGRIDSFRARMHLILGDRRFKPWKGSVVDSVVGVYLTQNVSDNLSSSAYMSLAAKYPLQTASNNTGEAYNLEGNMYFVTEPEPDRSCELKNKIQPMDSVIEGTYIVEMDEGSSNGHLTDSIQLSPALNTKADFVSPSKTFCPGSYSGFNELPVLENINLPQDLHYDGGMISSYEEGQGDMRTTSTKMDYGNQASTSGSINGDSGLIFLSNSYDPLERTISSNDQMQQAHHGYQGLTSGRVNELKVDHGFTSQSDSNDYVDLSVCSSNLESCASRVQQAQDATSLSKKTPRKAKNATLKEKKKVIQEPKDWELYRKMYSSGEQTSSDHTDSVDWDAVRLAEPSQIAKAIKDRGQHNIIAGRIQDFLKRLVKLHNGIDLEWLRNAPPEIVKEYLLEIPGLGLKSVECVRLLSLQHIAFPVDTNVGRIAVRLGWVPLQPLPESIQIHLLEQYPLMDTIQKYLWPRLCNLDQRTLYELHYQLITFGKVFCTKKNPNCGVCPLRGECKHFASAFASARLALPGPSESQMAKIPHWAKRIPAVDVKPIPVTLLEADSNSDTGGLTNNCEPIVEVPASPETQCTERSAELDIEDLGTGEDEEDIPIIRLQEREFMENMQLIMEKNNIALEDSVALALMAAEAASLPPPKLKSINRLRTEHLVYVLPDNHLLLRGFERREPDDPCPYLFSIWTPGETPDSYEKPVKKCNSGESELCNDETCYPCNTIREKNAGIVRGTILIPCRTANRGRFPLNGTYFQVNEVFADHETSLHPMSVPRSMIAQLSRQIAYFGSSATSIFRALDLPGIQRCFWRGYICVRGFDRQYRAPRPLGRRFHTSPSKMGKPNEKWHDDE